MPYRRFSKRKAEDAELASELQAHLDCEVEENIARGMPEDEARRRARVKLGNQTRVREEVWEGNSLAWLEGIRRDLLYAARTLARTPGFSMTAILVMALGIGATTALFTVVHSVLLKPLPFPHVDQLVSLREADAHGNVRDRAVAGGNYRDWQRGSHSFTSMALLVNYGQYNLSGAAGALPERIDAQVATASVFPTLGVKPYLGRFFNASDDRSGANGTVVITWGFWKRRFSGSPSAIGSTLWLDAKPYTVIGVLPEWFHYPDAKTQLWTPLVQQMPPEMMQSHGAHNFWVLARLKPGVTEAAATAELSAIQAGIRKRFPDGPISDAVSSRPLLDEAVHQYKPALFTLLAATGCLLLIACLNVANLLVARSAARRRELAIRMALGGTRLRLIREQASESLVICALGGLLGLGLAYLALLAFAETHLDIPRADSIHIDLPVFLVAVGVTLLCGLIAGLIPAIGSQDHQVVRVLQESSRSSGGQARVRLRRALLALEVGLTVVLLIGAGLLLKSYQQLRSVNLGCTTQNVLTMDLDLPDGKYQQPAQTVNFYEQLLDRVRRLPGVRAAALTTDLPGRGGEDDAFTIQEHPPLPKGVWLDADIRWVDPDYFATLQIPLVRGRTFLPNERLERRHYVIVNQALVRQYFPHEDPIGKHIIDENNDDYVSGGKLIRPTTPTGNEIIGVVGDTRDSVNGPMAATAYYPIFGGIQSSASLAVRTQGDPNQLALPIQKQIAQLDPTLPVANLMTMDEMIGQSTQQSAFNAFLLLAYAVLSLLLAAVGLYGVLAYLATQRTGEIGIRIALGAQREQVMRMMLVDGLRPALAGLLCGLAGGVAAAQLIRSMLYGTRPFDPAVFAAVTAVLLAVSAAACSVPAWRASRLDPMEALRTE
ncbi:MAG: ABC transporter permease [Acidobacteria bacterium]|nr:ABC transporter permease [Acidobacteriota bacterium]MBW4044811.1 ABC transporter permease [Acidobacteriota bacterium]